MNECSFIRVGRRHMEEKNVMSYQTPSSAVISLNTNDHADGYCSSRFRDSIPVPVFLKEGANDVTSKASNNEEIVRSRPC